LENQLQVQHWFRLVPTQFITLNFIHSNRTHTSHSLPCETHRFTLCHTIEALILHCFFAILLHFGQFLKLFFYRFFPLSLNTIVVWMFSVLDCAFFPFSPCNCDVLPLSLVKWIHDSSVNNWVTLIYHNTEFNLQSSWIFREWVVILLRYQRLFDYDQSYINHQLESWSSFCKTCTPLYSYFNFEFVVFVYFFIDSCS